MSHVLFIVIFGQVDEFRCHFWTFGVNWEADSVTGNPPHVHGYRHGEKAIRDVTTTRVSILFSDPSDDSTANGLLQIRLLDSKCLRRTNGCLVVGSFW